MMPISEETKKFIRQHKNDDINGIILKGSKFPDVDFAFAIRQIAGLQKIAGKVPFMKNERLGIIFPEGIPLEQCSSQKAAEYKASLVEGGETFLDLTGGFGIDFYFLSQKFGRNIYVEQNLDLCRIAKHNFSALNIKAHTIVNTKAEQFIFETNDHFDLTYIDPSRRNIKGQKVFLPEDCSPNLVEFQDVLLKKSDSILIKYAPMLDIQRALNAIRFVNDVYVVSVLGECKELLLYIKNKESVRPPIIHCVNIKREGLTDFEFTLQQERECRCAIANSILSYLYEPNSSVLKAGPFKHLSAAFDMGQLNKNSHLYTSDRLVYEFPGYAYQIRKTLPFNRESIGEVSKLCDRATVKTRNFPLTAQELAKRLKLHDGGDLVLFGTTDAMGKHILILCKKMSRTNVSSALL